ncbi:MAG: CHRD domain-containing protein [Vicinamibacterales bacterium]
MITRSHRVILAVSLGVCLSAAAFAQGKPEIYKARLSPLGVTNTTVSTTTGAGSATATLSGTTLTIEGTFEGLTGVATGANLRRGPKGIPGPVVAAIEFPKASNGKLSATVTLRPDQVDDLRAGRLYLQIHSERAPEGSIRGWLLK